MKNKFKALMTILSIILIFTCLTSTTVFAANTVNEKAATASTVQTVTKPKATTKITAIPADNSVTLNWLKADGAASYRVYQKTTNGWKILAYTDDLTYTIYNLKQGTKYTFAVTSYGESAVAGYYRTIETSTYPSATPKISTTQNNNSVTLKWQKMNGVSFYRIYQMVNNKWKYIGYSNKLTYTIKNLKQGYKYSFAVRSCIKTSSGVVAGHYRTIETSTKVAATNKITATSDKNSVTLNWNSVSGATTYGIYQKVNNKWKPLGFSNGTPYTINNLAQGQKHTFAVTSYIKTTSGLVQGYYKEIETATRPISPTNVKTSATESTVTISWDKVFGADTYRIYYRIPNTTSWKIAVNSTTATEQTIKNLSANQTYIFAIRAFIKTSSCTIWSYYDEIPVTTNSKSSVTPPASDNNVVAVTDGGIKLYEITSNEAKNIYNEWGRRYSTYYEGKNQNGIYLIFFESNGKWEGLDISGARYDEYGNIKYCPYCGKINGRGTDMCNGCNISFG